METDYLVANRLQDVLALIQVLGLMDQTTIISGQIIQKYRIEPRSKVSSVPETIWADIAESHPEFFRVSGESPDRTKRAMCLVSRFATEGRPYSSEIVKQLMEVAVDLYDRQARQVAEQRERDTQQRGQRLQVWSVMVAGVASLTGIIAVLSQHFSPENMILSIRFATGSIAFGFGLGSFLPSSR